MKLLGFEACRSEILRGPGLICCLEDPRLFGRECINFFAIVFYCSLKLLQLQGLILFLGIEAYLIPARILGAVEGEIRPVNDLLRLEAVFGEGRYSGADGDP